MIIIVRVRSLRFSVRRKKLLKDTSTTQNASVGIVQAEAKEKGKDEKKIVQNSKAKCPRHVYPKCLPKEERRQCM